MRRTAGGGRSLLPGWSGAVGAAAAMAMGGGGRRRRGCSPRVPNRLGLPLRGSYRKQYCKLLLLNVLVQASEAWGIHRLCFCSVSNDKCVVCCTLCEVAFTSF